MRLLAVDTSCDESCAAIIDTSTWKLLSDVVHSHVDLMQSWGGVVPELASREHLKALPLVVDKALKDAGLSLDEIDWFTVTNRPGLIGALLVGVNYVKSLAYAQKKPFSVFNHVEAHLFSPLLASLEGEAVPAFPWTALVVSGGHTELFYVESLTKHTWLGGTEDDAAGEAFDKIGKLLDFPYPAGPKMDQWIKECAKDEDRARYAFPRAKVESFSFSFSGLKTSVLTQLQKDKSALLNNEKRLALCASAQEAILDPLIDKLKAAQALHPESKMVVTGGVACNSRLRERLPEAHFPRPRHCTDNAAMVALLSALYEKEGKLVPSTWNSTAIAQSPLI